MAKSLPISVQRRIQEAVCQKADQHGYASQGRIANGRFMDDLVDDPEIGSVLSEYMPHARIRTYIKDGILNAYTKRKTQELLQAHDSIKIICDVYGVEQAFLQHQDDIVVCCNANEKIFVIGRGTVLKWETALRKALEFIARTPKLNSEGCYPLICLQLAVINGDITQGDRKHIASALAAVGVRVYFCEA